MPVEMVCNAFDISRSSYYEYRQRRKPVDVERLALKSQVNRLFTKSRSSAGSRTIKGMLNDDGVVIGRFKVRRLMSELGLICKRRVLMLTSKRRLNDRTFRTIWLVSLQ